MRPTGALHLGHYHGVLKNWIQLQQQYECFFFAADWHALTTNYDDTAAIESSTWDMVIDWLAAGVDPNLSSIFVQSKVPEHAELHLLLSMVTPLPWLERVPTYKDQQEKLRDKDLATYGFLGYPLLQSADILIYRAHHVPVGEDQVPHIEMTREIARRFNAFFGKEDNFKKNAETAIHKMGDLGGKYARYRKAFQQEGDLEALEKAKLLLESADNLPLGDRDRLLGYLEGLNRVILPEPQALLTPAAKMPGLDGQKMSKSYNNVISLRDDVDTVAKKIKTMPTDPARVRKTDPGNPEICPVWQLHQVYSDDSTKAWAKQGCTTAGIGCIQCKTPIIDAVNTELAPIQTRCKNFTESPELVRDVILKGNEEARDAATKTMQEVRSAMGLDYSRL
jgi:tryptophanyl-tRNA synthetase